MKRSVVFSALILAVVCSSAAMAVTRTPQNNVPTGPATFGPLGDGICDSPNLGPFGGPGQGNSVTDTIAVTGQGASIGDLDVDLQIGHTWVGDLDATLSGPACGPVQLMDQPGDPPLFGCSHDNIDATFDDEAANSNEATCQTAALAIGGSVQPSTPLSACDGTSADGTWTLVVTDVYSPSASGTLNTWCLNFGTGATTGGTTGGTPTPTTNMWGVAILIALFLGASMFFLRRKSSARA
jgi:subtilisin-like proprotein convertase family protein